MVRMLRREKLHQSTRKVPTASPARPVMWCFAGLSCGGYCHGVSTAMGWIPTAPISTARGSTAYKCSGLQVFLLHDGSRGRYRRCFAGFPTVR
jgi:hypothetical protein